MQLLDILHSDRIALNVNISSKKSLLEQASVLLSRAPQAADSRIVFDGLCQRERLGSTGLGHGVAIPHCRVDQAGATGAFIKLRKAIDFDSPDASPVDLFFTLAVPAQCSDTHLRLLASIATFFNDSDRRALVRAAQTEADLLEALSQGTLETSQ
ncbi:MAG: PTS sugar transporter subunit IIA [Pseudomonadota bacterium]